MTSNRKPPATEEDIAWFKSFEDAKLKKPIAQGALAGLGISVISGLPTLLGIFSGGTLGFLAGIRHWTPHTNIFRDRNAELGPLTQYNPKTGEYDHHLDAESGIQ